MKKSALRKLIRESIKELMQLNEAVTCWVELSDGNCHSFHVHNGSECSGGPGAYESKEDCEEGGMDRISNPGLGMQATHTMQPGLSGAAAGRNIAEIGGVGEVPTHSPEQKSCLEACVENELEDCDHLNFPDNELCFFRINEVCSNECHMNTGFRPPTTFFR